MIYKTLPSNPPVADCFNSPCSDLQKAKNLARAQAGKKVTRPKVPKLPKSAKIAQWFKVLHTLLCRVYFQFEPNWFGILSKLNNDERHWETLLPINLGQINSPPPAQNQQVIVGFPAPGKEYIVKIKVFTLSFSFGCIIQGKLALIIINDVLRWPWLEDQDGRAIPWRRALRIQWGGRPDHQEDFKTIT